MPLKDFNLNKNDYYCIFALALFSLILSAYYIRFNLKLGIYCSDVYLYLLNALYFTGNNIYSTKTIYLSPVICFLTSILFRLGMVDRLAIYIVTGAFAVIGNIGLYLLFKTRFDELLSLTGSVVFACFSINLTWLANGSLDIPAVSISIWIMLFAYLALKKNPKYYLALLPLIVIGFFTRYTVILLLPVLALSYLYENSFKIKKDEAKYIVCAAALGILTAAVILMSISSMGNGNLGFEGQIMGGIGGNLGSVKDLSYNPDVTYYLVNFANFISSSHTGFIIRTPALENPTILSAAVFIILAAGAILWIKKNGFETDRNKIAGIILCFVALISFNHISSFITILLVFLGLVLIGRESKNKNGLVMLGWFLVYFIFFSYYTIKVNRYIIPALPAFSYMIIASVELINEKINKENIIAIMLISLFIVQGFAFAFTFEDTNEFRAPEEMSDYIISNVDDWSDLKIGVYNMRPYHWYLGKNVTGIESSNVSSVESANVSYYISDVKLNLTNYTEIKNIDNLYLYEK